MKELCGCCEGLEKLTPLDIANRPGLDALSYRVGTHASFLETMMSRLTTLYLEVTEESGEVKRLYPLHDLSTRSFDDPSLALLDAWATVADVLTFYQERIANEGYLRTAKERRSILELARLVGYKLRPGVSASVFLAFDLEKDSELVIDPGMRVQSLPGPGELPQSFETGESLEAREAWNRLGVRTIRPQYIDSNNINPKVFIDRAIGRVYLKGISTNLKPNDPLLFIFEERTPPILPVLRSVKSIEAQPVDDRTSVILQQRLASGTKQEGEFSERMKAADLFVDPSSMLIDGLLKTPSLPPASPRKMVRELKDAFADKSDLGTQMLINLSPALRKKYYPAWSSVEVSSTPSQLESVEALRVKAKPFGHNAPLKPVYNDKCVPVRYEEWPLIGMRSVAIELFRTRDPDGRAVTTSMRFSLEIKGENFSLETDASASEVILGDIKIAPEIKDGKHIFSFSNDPDITSIAIAVENGAASIYFERNPKPDIIIRSGQAQQISKGEKRISASLERQPPFEEVISVTSTVPIGLSDEERKVLSLDAQYDKILPGSWVAIERPDASTVVVKAEVIKVASVQTISRADYGITGTVTELKLESDWLEFTDKDLSALRKITVYAQGEALPLAEEVIDPEKSKNYICRQPIELDGLYDGLKSGRWLIVSGERMDLGEARGVKASELVMLSNVIQKVSPIDEYRLPLIDKASGKTEEIPLPGDKVHTFLSFAKPLEYCYKRDTIAIYANVTKATHGETRSEVLGGGDGGKAFQEFQLRQSPLTYLAAPTPAGAESILQVRVNEVLWHEADSLASLQPVDRNYVISTDDQSKTSVIFGNGLQGSRLPSGLENVRAVYRSGIGRPGNVKAEQISQLAARPLGVKGVINPLPASGGADRESRDQARRNVPLSMLALDRLVSVQDYADFARTFAGIGKARATKLTNGRRQLVFLTIAGADDIPIDEHSDLYQNLVFALHKYGDPHQQILVESRELLLLVVSANVRVLPDYLWDVVEQKIRAAILDAFSFERRDLGQDVLLSEVISVIQAVEGVDYVDVDVLVSMPEKEFESKIKKITIDQNGNDASGDRRRLTPEEILNWVQKSNDLCHEDHKGPCPRIAVNLAKWNKDGILQPDQIAYLAPDVPDTLILKEVKL